MKFFSRFFHTSICLCRAYRISTAKDVLTAFKNGARILPRWKNAETMALCIIHRCRCKKVEG
jgi:hypothetical protein